MESISVRMEKFMRGSLSTTKSSEREWKFMPMGTCTWVNFRMEKNMVMVISSGSIYQVKTQKQTSSSSTMMDNGGAGCPMAVEYIKESTVILNIKIGDLYTGNFKNGLKHG